MSIVKDMLAKNGPAETFKEARKVAKEYVLKLRNKGRIAFSESADGGASSMFIARRTLPEVWEDTTMALLGFGRDVHTHYDPKRKNGEYDSFPSIGATVMMHIEEPFGEPR